MGIDGAPEQVHQATAADVPSMRRWYPSWRDLWSDDDALAAHRDRIAVHLCGLAVVLLLPFALHHGLAGRWPLCGSMVTVQVVLAMNAWTLRRGQPPAVPFWAMTLVLIAAVLASIWMQGLNGVFWAYPALFICYFVLGRRMALLLSCLLAVLTTVLVGLTVAPALALRLGATMALMLVMINVVLNVIGELQRAMLLQTITDPLTGAYNRRHLDAQLAAVVGSAGTVRSENALLAIDIDHFKSINDGHGHAVGDRVLKSLVSALGSRKRRSDMLFRTGGEEFVLLLFRTAPADATRVAEGMRQRIEQASLLPDRQVTVSIGLALQRPGQDASAWLQAADAALYDAKRKGRNRVVISDAA